MNYNMPWDMKQRTDSTKKLSGKLYDISPQNLMIFSERLASRVSITALKLTTNIKGKDLITQYGTLSIEDCRYESKSYLNLYSAHNLAVNTKAQLSAQMRCCIQDSISYECSLKVINSGKTCDIVVKRGTHIVGFPDRLLYFRILMSRMVEGVILILC